MAAQPIDFKTFPTTRYQGSKRKILPWIYDSLKELKFHTALDACGGSASVSYLMKKMGKAVTYNDKLHFNYIIGKAIIENQQFTLKDEDIAELKGDNPDIFYKQFITSTFKDIYYLPSENRWLDKMVNSIIHMNHYPQNVLEYKKALAYYALFQSSLIKRPFNLFHRKNLEIRTNDVKRSFGNKTTWEKSFNHYFKTFVEEGNRLVFDSETYCRAINESIFNIDPYPYDLVYIDIPYIRKDGSNESSNYLKCYHFLEGLSRYANWEKAIDYESINLRLKNIDQNNDFTGERIYESVEEILLKFRRNKIVFSYKKGGAPSIDFVIKTLKKLGKKTKTESLHYKYALNHQNGDAKNNREVLIIGV